MEYDSKEEIIEDKYCVNCLNALPETESACPNCGKHVFASTLNEARRIHDDPNEHKYCTKCCSLNLKNADKCLECGNKSFADNKEDIELKKKGEWIVIIDILIAIVCISLYIVFLALKKSYLAPISMYVLFGVSIVLLIIDYKFYKFSHDIFLEILMFISIVSVLPLSIYEGISSTQIALVIFSCLLLLAIIIGKIIAIKKDVSHEFKLGSQIAILVTGTIILGCTNNVINDKKITFGRYPQTHVWGPYLISILNTLTTTNSNGWYEYNGEEYAKIKATPRANSPFNFSDGTKISSGTSYWFKVEPIKWKVLDTNFNTTIITDKILDTMVYYYDENERMINGSTIYANNYEYSNIRAYMNGYDGSSYNVSDYTKKGFIDLAFTDDEESIIQTTTVDNSLQSTGDSSNPYVCDDTNDKVFSLSVEEANKYWTNDSDKGARPTDYALAKGAFKYNDIGLYWLRSPAVYQDCYYVKSVDEDCKVSSYHVNRTYYGVRPAMNIILD